MASTSWPAGAGTRVTTDPQYERLAASWAAPGVVGVPTDTPVVYADGTGTRVVKIRANRFANIRGWAWHSGTADISLPSLAANASGSNRYDTVVLRFSRSTYTVVEAVVQGANGGAAGAASLTQSIAEPLTSGTFEIPLAVVRVGAGATSIAAGDVTPCTWFSSADGVVVNSDSYYQPSANLGFPRLRHADLGLTYVPYSGAWRRADWGTAWGNVGGRKYTGSTAVANITSTLADTGLRTGATNLLAGRRYLFQFRAPITHSATSDVWSAVYYQVRKGDGTTALETVVIVGTANPGTHLVQTIYEPSSDESAANYQLWGQIQKLSGTQYNFTSIVRGPSTVLEVIDLGLAATVVVA